METSLLPLIVAIVLNMAIGMAWYSPKFFGNTWATTLGFDIKQLKATPFDYIGAMSVTIVTVAVTATLIQMFHINTLTEAIKLGVLLWVGFIATSHFSGVIWAKKPLKMYFIDTSYLLIITLLNTILFALWK